MPLLAGFVYYIAIFLVYAVICFAGVKLGAALSKRKKAKS